jgi:hypothetical protein
MQGGHSIWMQREQVKMAGKQGGLVTSVACWLHCTPVRVAPQPQGSIQMNPGVSGLCQTLRRAYCNE